MKTEMFSNIFFFVKYYFNPNGPYSQGPSNPGLDSKYAQKVCFEFLYGL